MATFGNTGSWEEDEPTIKNSVKLDSSLKEFLGAAGAVFEITNMELSKHLREAVWQHPSDAEIANSWANAPFCVSALFPKFDPMKLLNALTGSDNAWESLFKDVLEEVYHEGRYFPTKAGFEVADIQVLRVELLRRGNACPAEWRGDPTHVWVSFKRIPVKELSERMFRRLINSAHDPAAGVYQIMPDGAIVKHGYR